MAHDLTNGQIQESLLQGNASAWIWLFDVEVGASEIAYLTPFDASVSYGGQTYQPYPMTVPEMPEGKETAQQTAQLTVWNIAGELTARLRDDELIGNFVTIRLVHADHLSDTSGVAHRAKILGAAVSRERHSVTFTIGVHNWLVRALGRRVQRNRCDKVYGSDPCGYDTGRSGAMASCSKLFTDGSNGCVEHGDDEESAGLYRLHPRLFGGFEALPKTNRG